MSPAVRWHIFFSGQVQFVGFRYQACLLAKKLGYEDPAGIPAASDPVMQPHYIVRETAALVTSFLQGKI